LFATVAVLVVVVDQATKAVVAGQLDIGESAAIIGNLLMVVHGQNTGALFGLLGRSAPLLAILTPVVVGAIVWYQSRAGSSPLVAVALGLLLGGAIGNLIDRIRLGYVLDWVDAGIGGLRFWTFNVADASITIAILILLLVAAVPRLAELGVRRPSLDAGDA
jgi:signal peptidase II